MKPNKKKDHLRREGTLHPRADRVSAELVERSTFFDAADLMQMKYEMLRIVDIDNASITEAARQFGLSRVAYYRARRQYEQKGLAGLLPEKRGPKGPHKITEAVLAFAREQLTDAEQTPDWKQLSRKINRAFGAKIHPRSIERAVRRRQQ